MHTVDRSIVVAAALVGATAQHAASPYEWPDARFFAWLGQCWHVLTVLFWTSPAEWVLVGLGVVGGVAAILTMKAVIRQAKASEDAVKATRETMLLAHRPALAIRPIVVDGIQASGQLGDVLTNGRVWATNVGVFPVTVLRFHAQWHVGETLPATNPVRDVLDVDTTPFDLAPGHVREFSLPDCEVSADAYIAVNNGVNALLLGAQEFGDIATVYLIGVIKYRDAIGLRRVYWAFAYDPRKRGFVPVVDHPNYSYED